jgi:mannose-6-phosphate isomerase class I
LTVYCISGYREITVLSLKQVMNQKSNFNKTPSIKISGWEQECWTGWESICTELSDRLRKLNKSREVVAVECYQGVDHEEILNNLKRLISFDHFINTADLFLPEKKIIEITYPDVTDDRVFGYMTRLNLIDFFDKKAFSRAEYKLRKINQGTILVYGHGASLLVPEPDLLVYFDMARWEIQLRMRRDEGANLGISNRDEHFELKYKRGFFVDWRVCDRLKKKIMNKWDFILDTNIRENPKMLSGNAFREGLKAIVSRPFSVVPYFDPGPWGGQWMKEKFNPDSDIENYAWCFNCVPEENSIYMCFGDIRFETPAINLVFYQPVELLGHAVHARFGDEFPIRFDFLDTMQGGNLSLQVHPTTEYIREKFGMHYTQDESYYLIDTGDDASVYLGLKEGIDPGEMMRDLQRAEKNEIIFDDKRYIQNWPAKKHDHFLIPGGTVHCSGKNTLVLEISSTPYIFTFKLWDWGRKGLDGKPRPINIVHGANVIQWDRTTEWTREQLINKIARVSEGDGWIEERTGLHEREFIETRRHWFTKKVMHNTCNGVNVLNLVEGSEAIVEDPTGAFEPFIVHYAETFIVPARVGEYTIRPGKGMEGRQCVTVKAYVRTNP